MSYQHSFLELNLGQMSLLAKTLASCINPADVITLAGEVGAGKTTFARSLIQALSKEPVDVTSPTFNLMQSYDVILANNAAETLWHLDLYRLKSANELEALGFDELLSHIVVIEWPEIIERKISQNSLGITFTMASPETRSLSLHGNDAWRKRLASLKL